MSAMRSVTSCVFVPLLAVSALLPAQSGVKSAALMKPKAGQDKVVDSKLTKNDPAIRALDKFIKKQSVSTKKRGWRLSLSEPP